jgi:FlaA1/EpsC-like NDP-sugar epimerase
MTLVSFLLALMLRFEFNAIDYFLRALLPVILAGMIIRPMAFALGGIYRRVWRYATTRDFFHLALAVLVGSILISIVAFSLYPRYVYTLPRSVLGIEFALSLILLGGVRVVIHQLERYPGDILWRRVKLDPARKVLIVGAGNACVQMYR